MATEHKNIPDPNRHEPKGISTATSGQIYRSDGAASGAWKDDIVVLNGLLTDVSDPSFVLIPISMTCTVIGIRVVLKNAITIADANLAITRGGDAASLGSIVVPFTGSAEGTSVSLTPVSNNTFVAGVNNYIKIATDGGSTTASILYISVKVKVTE